MQAAIFHGDQRITVGETPMPRPAAGEVLLRVRRTALCGSDTKLWLSGARCTPGHEIFGVAQQPGHALDGRRCLVYIPVHCGDCASCLAGDTQMCLSESVLIGWNRPGGYAEYLAVPEQCLLPVPDDIEDELAPLLLDTIGTAAHGIRFVQPLLPPKAAGAVLVTGAGPVGIGALIALQNIGYTDVHVSDPREERLQLAESFGARRHPAGDASKRFQLIVECSGAHAARSLGMEIVLPRGVLILIGESDKPWPVQENKAIRRKDFYMVRTFYFPKSDFPLNVALLRSEKARYRKLVDAQFGIHQLPEMFRRFAAGELVKPLLAFA
ncbi:alcohol dehydrogenase [Verminephrobacter aporrectodeae subsp. tuberculatae]|uniref:alcohol dehydrogenase catalytic domain-containing protein n=1 Tax=Verminephrobacter aporrectodeae TaxID=1110389 RepID=UPI00224388BE|nr:alcohol dehydrogenase catalytic domain-containing protein [Verminephrobacter aporrectodeae]MCW8199523.1 alcohol dehydrogenase [Verminephrobacter aporrectodeae subsp. tuberculatae]